MSRAEPSGISLTPADAAIVKGMLLRGDRQHDIAAWFGVNPGRIADIGSTRTFPEVSPIAADALPPPGPYLAGRDAHIALKALEKVAGEVRAALDLLREQKSADTATYVLEEIEKSVEAALISMRDRVKELEAN